MLSLIFDFCFRVTCVDTATWTITFANNTPTIRSNLCKTTLATSTVVWSYFRLCSTLLVVVNKNHQFSNIYLSFNNNNFNKKIGKIDEDTILKMAKPRCGNKDFDMQFSSSKFLSFRTNDFSKNDFTLIGTKFDRYSKFIYNILWRSTEKKPLQVDVLDPKV